MGEMLVWRRLVGATILVALGAGAVDASRATEEPLASREILGLTPELERFIDARVRPHQSRTLKLQGLMDALFGKDGLGIAYGTMETRTPAETFASRSGNCLSFTILFVALARHVGLEAYFHEGGEILSWDRRGDVAVSNRHMFAMGGSSEGLTRVDFLPGVEKRYRSVRRIDEQRVLAHFYSNLGAEALTADDLERAMGLFRRALAADAELAAIWVNKGVTHRRLGELEEAEASYLRALELDPQEVSAATNLASLYLATDRERQAAPYLKKVERHRRRNPFYHFRQGMEASRRGQLQLAARSLKRAVRLMPEDVMFRAELGKLQLRAGRPRRAESSFRRALALAADDAQRARLTGLIERARAAA